MRKTVCWFIILLVTWSLSVSVTLAQPLPHPTVEILVNRDGVNIRLFPAIGAEVVGFVNAGWVTLADARSPDNQWVRVDFNGQEGWIGVAVINIFGDINSLTVADPRTIPYGGFDSPRSGPSDASSAIIGRLALSGLRLRAGPSTAYPVLANPLRYSEFPLLGRTANNAWLQVNFEGTLGWVAAQWVEIQGGHSIVELPIDGVVASGPPTSADTEDNYFATLRLMLDRVNIAQTSLDAIRSTWTTVALGQRAACTPFPPRPSDINIANPLLAAFYPTLNPLQTDFNIAMSNVRLAIDLWIEACSQRTLNSNAVVGQATVEGALNAIQIADGQFADLRRRLNELIPPLLEVGADQCLFTFQGKSDVLQRITVGEVVLDSLTPRKTSVGYCFDANTTQSLRFEVLQLNGNIRPLLAVSLFDNPSSFLAVGRGTGDPLLTVAPVTITMDGVYLLILSDISEDQPDPVNGDYALLISNIAGAIVSGPGLSIDPTTGQLVVNPVVFQPTAPPIATPGSGVACPSTAFTCQQLFSCAEAQACLAAGNFSLDPDADGIPCEENLCTGN
ncbi:MAG: SH3 domain-containing protein [Anaerolineaceae bacterium]|nr:SH3 domain-containing protein [Anaerolineaceae bacterium]